MTTQERIEAVVGKCFKENPIPRNYHWMVFSTYRKGRGKPCWYRWLVLYHGRRPKDVLDACHRKEIVLGLPPSVDVPQIEGVCGDARCLAV
jgi:hypothetical protein